MFEYTSMCSTSSVVVKILYMCMCICVCIHTRMFVCVELYIAMILFLLSLIFSFHKYLSVFYLPINMPANA